MNKNRSRIPYLFVLSTVIMAAGCTDTPIPATTYVFPTYPVPITASGSNTVTTPTLATATATRTSTSAPVALTGTGSGGFNINIPASALGNFQGTVAAKAVTLSSLTAAEQAAIQSSSGGSTKVVSMIQVDLTPTGTTTSGFHVNQASSGSPSTFTFKLRPGDVGRGTGLFPCKPGKVDLVKIIGGVSSTPNATVTISDVKTDADGQYQEITGTDPDSVEQVRHFIWCTECPEFVASATPLPAGSALPANALPSFGGITVPNLTTGTTAAQYCQLVVPIYSQLLPLLSQYLSLFPAAQQSLIQTAVNQLSTQATCVSYLNGLGLK